jgi:putative copper export protein/mono/diheme cytochrome c family protein
MTAGVVPAFAIEGGLPLALARFVSVAGLIAAFGSLFYARWLRPPGLPPATHDRLHRLGMLACCAAIGGALVWLLAQTADFAGSVTPSDMLVVLTHTRFGNLLAGRLCLLVLALLASRSRLAAAASILAGAALVLQAGQSHAAAMGGPPLLLVSSVLHLLAAGVWLGGLPALWVVLSGADHASALASARRFSTAGLICVAVLLATSALQFSDFVVGLPGLVGTAYGWMAGTKILLFAALIGLAARNRLVLTPALAAAAPKARTQLTRAITGEIAIGMCVLVAASVLTELQPAMHMQPVWPFAERFSLVTIDEDPDFYRAVIESALALAGALVLLAAALFARRFRLPAAVIAGATAWFALPNVSLLLVEANPYSFFHSPTGFASASIVRGASLYPSHCAACHGAAGHGDGPLAKTLPVPPADLTAGHLWMHSDGDLFHWITDGIEAPRGGQAMPGFASSIPDDDRWALIDYIRGHNAGTMMQAMGRWMPPLHAPDFSLQCGGHDEKLSGLRGQPIRLILGGDAAIKAEPGMVTILAAPDAAAHAAPGVCVADDPAIPQAYAIVSGTAPNLPDGEEFLIDGDGWLRAMQRPGGTPGWDDPAALAKAVAAMRAQKLSPAAPAPMPMNMPM